MFEKPQAGKEANDGKKKMRHAVAGAAMTAFSAGALADEGPKTHDVEDTNIASQEKGSDVSSVESQIADLEKARTEAQTEMATISEELDEVLKEKKNHIEAGESEQLEESNQRAQELSGAITNLRIRIGDIDFEIKELENQGKIEQEMEKLKSQN